MHFHVYLRLNTSETVTWIAVSINYIYTIQCETLRLDWNITYALGRYSYQSTFNQPLDKCSIRNALQILWEEKTVSRNIYINHNTFPFLHNRINSKTYKNIHLLLLDIKHYSREKLLLNESYTANNSGASHMTNLIYKFTINPLALEMDI